MNEKDCSCMQLCFLRYERLLKATLQSASQFKILSQSVQVCKALSSKGPNHVSGTWLFWTLSMTQLLLLLLERDQLTSSKSSAVSSQKTNILCQTFFLEKPRDLEGVAWKSIFSAIIRVNRISAIAGAIGRPRREGCRALVAGMKISFWMTWFCCGIVC